MPLLALRSLSEASGTTFNQSVNVSVSAIPIFISSVGKKVLALPNTAVSSLLKIANKAFQALPSSSIPSLLKQAGKILQPPAVTNIAKLLKNVDKKLFPTGIISSTISASRLFLKAISATSSTALTLGKSIGKRINPTPSSSIPQLLKQTAKAIPGTSSASPTVKKQAAKAVQITSTWTPASLSTAPKVWLDPSDAATVTLSSGRVSQLADKSGNGINASQATAGNQPSIVAGINGLNALSLDHTRGDNLGATLSLTDPTHAVFIVATGTADTRASSQFRRLLSFGQSGSVDYASDDYWDIEQDTSNLKANRNLSIFG
jgi:hypothetical protein